MQSVSECDAHLFLALIFRNLISVDGDNFNLKFLLSNSVERHENVADG